MATAQPYDMINMVQTMVEKQYLSKVIMPPPCLLDDGHLSIVVDTDGLDLKFKLHLETNSGSYNSWSCSLNTYHFQFLHQCVNERLIEQTSQLPTIVLGNDASQVTIQEPTTDIFTFQINRRDTKPSGTLGDRESIYTVAEQCVSLFKFLKDASQTIQHQSYVPEQAFVPERVDH